MKQLIMDYTPYVTRAALVEDGEMIAFSVEMAKYRGIVGNIYKGKVENVLSGMKAAFVNIGLEKNGFLYIGDSLVDNKGLENEMPAKVVHHSPGDIIMCQVVKDQFGTKGARLTTDVSIPGYYVVMIPDSSFLGVSRKIEDFKRREYLEELVKSVAPPNTGFIIRSAADKASDADIINEIGNLSMIWSDIQEAYKKAPEKSIVFEDASLFERAIRDTFAEKIDRIIVNDEKMAEAMVGRVGKAAIECYKGDRNIMAHYNLTSQINHICDRKVPIKNGGYLIIDKTEAFTVIDVNTGKFVGSKDLEDTVFNTNLCAADAIAKILRLRNISGIVVIDFIDMLDENHKTALLDRLSENLKKDNMKTTAVGITQLGLVELTRKKTRLPLDDFMLQPCAECGGGFVVSDAQLAFMLRDELVDYLLASKHKHCYVGLHPAIFDVVFETGLLNRHINTSWKDKKVFLYKDPQVAREKFNVSFEKPSEFEKELVRLQLEAEEE